MGGTWKSSNKGRWCRILIQGGHEELQAMIQSTICSKISHLGSDLLQSRKRPWVTKQNKNKNINKQRTNKQNLKAIRHLDFYCKWKQWSLKKRTDIDGEFGSWDTDKEDLSRSWLWGDEWAPRVLTWGHELRGGAQVDLNWARGCAREFLAE